MQFNIEEFGPNIIANKTTYKSPVFVVSSRQMVIYLTYAILLDPKQQEELGVRPKSATGLDDGLNVVMQCGIEYTGKSDLAKADKGYERGHTYIYFIMGQEEKDGSLTFTLCMDADPAGSIPKSFADRANAEQYKKAVTMHNLIAKLAKDEKNKAHRIKQFDNDRLFQPMV
ncbi:hypothetical protein AGDE_00273 [Angomonas deanei]|uniref:START domain containing protein n=1 Tax=Angomonas deanei TaxID=59799 RepID=A0A7G2CAR8_9TRYP|nr:hypothetical protein AGDE_00273 [Angomonas deanei]CAD2216886.1 hypothetical protein, conserved [Angomonas deanei]|eukprot:EPY43648.1 hypothetical protein AGDE_00273 [Angomonas deanei]